MENIAPIPPAESLYRTIAGKQDSGRLRFCMLGVPIAQYRAVGERQEPGQ